MATSLAFGVVFATSISLFLVPSSYLILEDCKRLFRRRFLSHRSIEGADAVGTSAHA
jgi:hypothetical protein